MQLDVIGAGLGRTGTLSMKRALEILGFGPCHHMYEIIEHKQQAAAWHALSAGEAPNWERLLGGYRSVVDFPGCIYTEELAAACPAAKIVLTTRDGDKWYESAKETIGATRGIDVSWLYPLVPKLRHVKEMQDRLIWQGFFGGRFDDPAFAKARKAEHEARLVEHFEGTGRLLVMHVSEGWGPLCRHLGVPVPDEPFPDLNDTEDFKKDLAKMRMASRGPWLLSGAVLLVLAGVLLL